MKKQGDFVIYSRNSVLINALVAFSRQVFLPEGPTEHLTLVYLDPAAASAAPTGEQLRNSIKVQADVPPLAEGAVNGWKEVDIASLLPLGWTAGLASAISAAEQMAKEATDPAAPASCTPESMAAQDEHDRATGNVNEKGETPHEAVEAEKAAPETPASFDPGGTGGVVVMDGGDFGKGLVTPATPSA